MAERKDLILENNMKTEYELRKTFTFEAAHQLKHHDGKCARLHGHSFKLTIVVAGAEINPEIIVKDGESAKVNAKANMLLDYGVISEIVKPFVENYLDHHFLNETLENDSPTSEFIALFCFRHFQEAFNWKGGNLREIRISETCTSEAIYRRI